MTFGRVMSDESSFSKGLLSYKILSEMSFVFSLLFNLATWLSVLDEEVWKPA